ncbi:hypothetical protein AAE485_00100 [Acidithiobacillus ferriphilus]|uniref:hypothetical protein n=1 Tax=Acidithiobacillus ferriphilus TaxID=1689834 RepID=UPI00390C6230
MSLFDQVMDRVFRAVRADRLPVAYQFSAARMIDERNTPAVAEWLADATEERIREALEHIVFAGSWCEDGAVIQATQTMERDRAVATCIECTCDDLHGCAEGCSWLRLDRKTGLGLCSACSHRLADWDMREKEHCAWKPR